jgi:hypothetical protein
VDRTSGLADIACPFTGEKDRKSEAGESRRQDRGVNRYALVGDCTDSHFISAALNFGWETKRCQIIA